MKILIVKRDKLGDLLLTTPMLAWLKQAVPQAELHVLANDYNAWVIDGNPHADKVWVLPRVRHAGKLRIGAALQTARMLWQMRREKFDWVLVGNGEESPRAIERGLSVRGAHTVSYCKQAKDWPRLTHALPQPQDMHESRRLANLATPLGLQVPAELPAPLYLLPQSGRDFATSWLAQQGFSAGGYVVLGLGARRAKKQPSTAQVLEWSEQIAQRWGLKTVFMWTPGASDNPLYPGDDEVAEPVLAANSPNIVPFRGPLKEAIALVWHARASLFPDSGLMHFAAASPGGVLGFFAETDISPSPSQWGPIGPKAQYLEAEKSVADLSTDAVFAKLTQLIE
ncbi:glycosyltransferase family 9 protein [Uliginosibacterium sp. H3]|uniref:Glycosyltransferase family 9 protein n=1 Tax=Uliginosibacterium silvisoli TaxID=3114758 RepID=A0ABU6K1G5_9RHOO|nr:glycosyltransferase family 9 protein [Uliginosibacterium sp. H3]